MPALNTAVKKFNLINILRNTDLILAFYYIFALGLNNFVIIILFKLTDMPLYM